MMFRASIIYALLCGVVWCCVVLCGVAWCCVVVCGFAWCCIGEWGCVVVRDEWCVMVMMAVRGVLLV